MSREQPGAAGGDGDRVSGVGDAHLERADALLLRSYDAAMAEAYRRGGGHLVCHAGCTECCIGPFGISALDARRLRQGLAELEASDPARAKAIRRRAEQAVEQLRSGFPGDPWRGVLDERDAEAQFLDSHADLPCPVLDPTTGRCELYRHRPLSCRAYGPPLRLADDVLEPCRLCFRDASPQVIESCRLDPDPEGFEDTVLEAVERASDQPLGGDTLIAFALLVSG